MRMLYTAALSVGILMPIGCEKSSGTAPSTNPSKPGETRQLTLTLPAPSQSITQGSPNEVMVNVNRDNFKEPVELDVRELPKGVTVETKDMTIPSDKNTFTITLRAAPDAPPVNDHEVHIHAKTKDIKEPVMVKLKLSVKAK
ncbi:MAG TPA: hypothetical protein VM597_26680 [Gemmataceae bacterium]|jgi:hypothetical protein|nr:hypothetical protein [Gemmataceae bacterium]